MPEYSFRRALEAIKPYKKGEDMEEIKAEYGLETIARLMSNENPYGCSALVKNAVVKAMNEPSNYPDDYTTAPRAAIAKKYNIDKDEIIFGNGTDEIIYFLGKAFIEEGDEVITGKATFFSYEESVLAMGGKMVYVPMKNHGFDLAGIIEAITDKTKMIIVCNPNNPTGTVFHEKEQLEFLARIPKNIIVVVDEAYAEFYMGENYPDTFSKINELKNLIILKTFSKAYGLASFRIGFAISNKETITMMTRAKNLFNVSAQAQAAAVAAMEDQAFVEMVRLKNYEAIKYLCTRLDSMGISYIPTHASFIMIEYGSDVREVVKSLLKCGYMVREGDMFNMPGHIRISIGTREQMEGFANALENIISSL